MSSTRWTIPAVVTIAALTVSAAAVQAAVFTPTKGADTFDGACNNDCSLREAVAAANDNPGADVILLNARVYALTRAGGGEDGAATGDLDITDPLILVGDGAASTIVDGGGLDRIFHVLALATLELSDVTLRNGFANGPGGAVLNQNGTVSIARSVLSGNRASGAGGAIYNETQSSELSVAESTLSANVAGGVGGALATVGVADLVNCTLSANRTTADFGGAVYVYSVGEATIRNSTLVDNVAVDKGGGLYAEQSAFIGIAPLVSNSILARNTASSNPDCAGSVASGGYNLVSNGTGCGDFKAANHDLAGTQGAPLDAKLGPLGENGGPTPTHAPLAGSPALNAGNPEAPEDSPNACVQQDQRGASRPAGASCDIGAVEQTSQCVRGGGTLCLNEGRFRLTATFKTGNTQGEAKIQTLTGDTGYFWFFDPANVEVTVKVLTGCGLNNRYWVFAAGLTNVEVNLTVTDTKTGVVKTYKNPANTNFKTILDTTAFNTCP